MTKQHQYLERAQRHIGIVDAVMLMVVAAGAYLLSSDSGGASVAFASQIHAASAPAHQICSDEELRQMRSGPETCYMPATPDKHEFSLAPSLGGKGSSVHNAGRQPPSN
nr:hypothetical protein [uncultured Dongia sp.]